MGPGVQCKGSVMSNLVSPLLGADVLVFKPLTDQEQVRPTTQANVMKSTSHPEDLMDYTIVERDFTVLPANTENVLFERVNSETLYELGGGKDRSEISEGVEKYFKVIFSHIQRRNLKPIYGVFQSCNKMFIKY